jgi:putative membrane protein
MALELAITGVAAVLYRRGLVALRARPAGRRTVPPWRVWAFVAGLAVAAVAVAPPLHDLAHEALSAHMVQHVLLILLAAPLIAAGAPQLVIPRAVPGLGHNITAPIRRRLPETTELASVAVVVGAGAHLLVLWAWHAPIMYEAALSSALVHALEHATMVGTALLVWGAILRPGRRARLASGIGVVGIWLLLAQGAVLSALLVFSREPLYPAYAGMSPWGLDALADQQLAGLVMWLPGGIVYGIAGVATFIVWFRAVEERAQRLGGTAPPAIIRAPDARPAAGSRGHPPASTDGDGGGR